ncbi:MAG: TrmH family RNA methyltransferase, partial [Spirochaetia bacterium]
QKLASLPGKTRLRKIVTIIDEWGRLRDRDALPEKRYVREVLSLLKEDRRLNERVGVLVDEISEMWPEGDVYRRLDHLKYALMEKLGLTPADWDFYDPGTRSLSREGARVLPIRVYLDDIRSPFNVGSIFRTAEAFGAESVFLSHYTASPDHSRALRSSMGCTEVLPWSICEIEELQSEEAGNLIALELGGTPLEKFSFPSRPNGGTVVVGSEELGISPEARTRAEEEGGIVSIPLFGGKASLNVAVAFGILMERWSSSISGD